MNYWSLQPKRQELKFTKAMMERCKSAQFGLLRILYVGNHTAKANGEPTHR